MHTTTTYRPEYPKRRYRDASEPAVGDVVRMDDCDRDGNLIESQCWSDSIISEIRLGTTAVLCRPRAKLVDGKIALVAEVFECPIDMLIERFHVCTTGWGGNKASADTTRERCLMIANLECSLSRHLWPSISHRPCPTCGELVVGVGGTCCPDCQAKGLAA